MKKITTLLYAGIIFVAFSCSNNSTDKKADEGTMPSESFNLVFVKHPVADFNTWKTFYDGHDTARQAAGLHSYKIGRGLDDSNMVFVLMKVDDIQKAKAFGSMPGMEEVMKQAGVTGIPEFHYMTVIRNDDSPINYAERIMVMHKVKDFDAWLKVFDAEGKATREANGIIDRGLARDADDPNIVYLAFAISDMEKAKARMNSEELKTIMMQSGVEGEPVFNMYRWIN